MLYMPSHTLEGKKQNTAVIMTTYVTSHHIKRKATDSSIKAIVQQLKDRTIYYKLTETTFNTGKSQV